MRRTVFASILGLASAAGVAGCSIEDRAGDARPTTSSTATSTTTTTSTTAPTGERSAAFVEVAGAAYDLDATCHAPGVGEVVITAQTPGLVEPRIELYLQAFLAEPYVGISVTSAGETTLYEPSLAAPLEIVQQDDVFRVDDVALVTDLDLETGAGTDAGPGTVVVECASYEDGLPPGFGSG